MLLVVLVHFFLIWASSILEEKETKTEQAETSSRRGKKNDVEAVKKVCQQAFDKSIVLRSI